MEDQEEFNDRLSKALRAAQRSVSIVSTFKPSHQTLLNAAFEKARGKNIVDCGVVGTSIVITLLGATFEVRFKDPNVTLLPHREGKILDYHEFAFNKLTDIRGYTPTAHTMQACIFVIATDNGDFEYLVEGKSAMSYVFEGVYLEADHA